MAIFLSVHFLKFKVIANALSFFYELQYIKIFHISKAKIHCVSLSILRKINFAKIFR